MKYLSFGLCAAAAIAGFFSALVFSGGINDISIFFDPPPLLMVAICPLLLLRSVWKFKAMGHCLASVFRPDADRTDMEDAAVFLGALRHCLFAAGVVGTLIGICAMFKNLMDKSQIGPNIALALLSLFYAALLAFLICLPLEGAIKKRLVGSETGGRT